MHQECEQMEVTTPLSSFIATDATHCLYKPTDRSTKDF